ncbi:hypothetical protein ECBG_00496 [Enterococcus casseliflavus EC20]|uniref:Uncharacterized protein n=1 Tax=Enterococcus casseliflavus EC20 TaxID=565655 RepID=C9A6W6_ENTCA|nr:ATP-grasp fold amidoligase family protein [Enterococcus casseliflavus]EEV38227.1 hypothetical protein ECBG_00496 [Enterococcus casseliflavus EC20]
MIRRLGKQLKIRLNFLLFKINREKFLIRKCNKLLGYKINFSNPQTYNEKIQWLKLYWYDEKAKTCVDKFLVRDYVEKKGYKDILNELYGVYNNFDDINFDVLPNSYVLKATHNSGDVIIVNENKPLNMKIARKKLDKLMKTSYFQQSQEWVYKDLKPRIICEEYIESENNKQAKDYKFFCFEGKVKFLFVASDRGYSNGKVTTKFDFYTPEWNKIDVQNGYPQSEYIMDKPKNLDEMIKIAETLSKDFPHVRVDLYNEYNEIRFGELTFFHFSGTTKFDPFDFDQKFGQFIDLSKIKKTVYADEK